MTAGTAVLPGARRRRGAPHLHLHLPKVGRTLRPPARPRHHQGSWAAGVMCPPPSGASRSEKTFGGNLLSALPAGAGAHTGCPPCWIPPQQAEPEGSDHCSPHMLCSVQGESSCGKEIASDAPACPRFLLNTANNSPLHPTERDQGRLARLAPVPMSPSPSDPAPGRFWGLQPRGGVGTDPLAAATPSEANLTPARPSQPPRPP